MKGDDVLKKQVVCEYYLNKDNTFVLRVFLVIKFWFITVKKVPTINLSESLSFLKKDSTYQLIKDNLYSEKCNSCTNGFDGTNGNGYQPCGCNDGKPSNPPVAD